MRESNHNADIRALLVKYASRLLTGRPYFSGRLLQKLKERSLALGCPDTEDVSKVLADLDKAGFLNDRYLAEAYVRKQLAKGYGSRYIPIMLKRRGADPQAIKRALEVELHEKAELESAEKYLKKSRSTDKRKLASKLYSRGYPGSIIRKVLQYNY